MDADRTDTTGRWRYVTNSQWGLLEFVASVAIITVVLGLSMQSFFAYRPRLRQLGALMLTAAAKSYAMEYRAEHGEWPERFDVGDKNVAENTWFWLQTRPGAMDFTFSDREPSLAGQVLTVSAWQLADGANLPVAWSCGRARVDSLMPAAQDHTTLRDDELVSPCRKHWP